jgi:hypothetical protein
MTSSAIDRNILQSNLLTALYDSQTQQPFENAQIVNCKNGHSYGFSTAEKIYGLVIDGLCKKPAPCSDCGIWKTM